ncbi:MAG: glycerate kinase [Azospirillaceae bacterium]
MSGADPGAVLRGLFDAALAAVSPELCVPPALPEPGPGRTIVLGAGKAAAAMARTVEAHWPGALEGLVVTRYGHGVACERIAVVEAAHPVPDEAGIEAAARILDLARAAGPEDLVLCLISGGGSALLAAPAEGLTLADKRAVATALLRSGASIDEINAVRKHLSAIKGGRLAAAAAPARVVTLAISDVPGDDPATIASGPTVADPTTFDDALAVLSRYGIGEPAAVIDHLRAGAEETPKPGDPRLARAETRIVATAWTALAAAAEAARKAGLTPVVLGDAIEGEAREVARALAGIADSVARHGAPAAAPAVLISGGETTVTVRGQGRGGRNLEFLLGLGLALDGRAGIHALAADTDGIDGSEDNAGARLSPDTLARARAAGVDPAAALAGNDAHAVFEAAGDLIVTGPTRTNVNDFRAILVEK